MAGKAVAKLNSVTHGLRSIAPVLPTESPHEWAAHRAGIVDALAERIVLLLWRLGRGARFETAVATAAQEETEREYTKQQAEKQRYESRYVSCAPEDLRADLHDFPARARLLRRLAAMDADKRVAGADAADILQECGRVAGYRDDTFDADAVDYPLARDSTGTTSPPSMSARSSSASARSRAW